MKSIHSFGSAVVSVLLLSISASEALASGKMQNENRQFKMPTSIEYPNLHGTGADSKRATSVVVDRDLDQPDMDASKSEVSIESRKKPSTSMDRQSPFLPEVGDEVLLRKRGQPHKQPPSPRGPHKQPPTGRGPHKMP